jgi:hypothetical protein
MNREAVSREWILNYPALSKVLAFQLDSPLFQNAQVEVHCQATPNEEAKFRCDKDSAKLLLPAVDKPTLDKLPKQFTMTLKHPFEDKQAQGATFYLTFDVQITGSKQKPDGMYSLQYEAKLKDYTYEI